MSKISQYQDASNNPDLQSYFDLSEKIAGLYQSRRLSLLQLKNYLQSNVSIDFSQITGYTPYTLPIADSSTLGGVKIGSGINVAFDGTISVAPAPSYDEVINFSTLTPVDPGVVFTPNTPTTTGVLYVSNVDASTWIWDGAAYITSPATSSSGTPFDLSGTTTDAGSSKTASIERSGKVYIKTDGSNYLELFQQVVRNVSSQSAVQAIIVGSNTPTDYPSREMKRHRGTPSSPSYTQLDDIIASDRHASNNAICYEVQTIAAENHSVTVSGSKTIFKTIPLGTNIPEEILQFTENGKLKFNGAYQFPKVDGTAGQYLATTGLGTLAWTSLPPASSLSGSGNLNKLAKWTPDGSTLGDSLIEDDGSGVGLCNSPSTLGKISAISSDKDTVFWLQNPKIGGINTSLFALTNGSSTTNTGVVGKAQNGTTSNYGVKGIAASAGLINYAISGEATGGLTNIGIRSYVEDGANNYVAWLQKAPESVQNSSGKFLKSITGDGKANWADITSSDISGVVGGSGINERLAVWSPDANTLDDTQIYYNTTTGNSGFGASYTGQNRVYIEQRGGGLEPLRVQTVRGDLGICNAIVGISNVAGSASGDINNGIFSIGHGQTDPNSCNIGIIAQAGNTTPTITKNGDIGGRFYANLSNRTNFGAQFITTSVNSNDNYGIYIENSNSGAGDSHAVWIVDNNEAVGKILTCRTVDGKGGWEYPLHAAQVMCSDLDTAITADAVNKKGYWTAPADGTIREVFADLDTAQASGSLFTVDIKKNGVSIFSTLLTFDNTELTTLTATTAAVISTTDFVKGDRFAVYVTQVGDGTAKGLLATINYERKS